ncbi:MAG: repressor LexA [Elusimicrobia bacterium]|nr:repressor LexA [Elusimicrobiota bacterium]
MTFSPGLTRKQQQVLDFIAKAIEGGCPPTLREIADHFGLGITTIQDHVIALESKGVLDRQKDKARSFRIVGRPEPGSHVRLPVVGHVRAGVPVEAIEDVEQYLLLDRSVAGGADFILRVQGDSMEPEMREGDLALVKQATMAESGEPVIVHVGNDEATVKCFRRRGREAWLEATNSRYSPIKGRPFKIVGKVIGLVRTYRGAMGR